MTVHLSLPSPGDRRRSGVILHRRFLAAHELTRRHGIPVTTPICTLIDLASYLNRDQLEAAINEADKRGLTDPERLRYALDQVARRPGVGVLRQLIDHHAFTLTESELERRFIPLALQAGLSMPLTGHWVNGFKVDFYWPELGLVVETDGLRYHRTAVQQAKDRRRDQAHARAGLTALRFTRGQVRFEAEEVQATLREVVLRLKANE
jgi:very-short-patch-repair endonuclease